ncbi:pentatricopeptide repeat-containing protein At5g66500, mitochondrial [Elaeis guineensis]|uniref:Pentatricopeptide repeat-containing protein At5g66500, mitochondrial n=1 Tax=Elaeis guineensis var. tenera TaxID=51953 RepID=A0A6I9RK13_ELAGV|nr:pentatricopeptide repeat-containing protein At5g66500, mitochondrial [Elaeis guineensis]XP_010927625.1 pentatricopeptide repeat-containing protein At5g66500, mitochondrial [Elaeis guineensis]XP_010927626.1 pentatricopeptide repeat-containing protein At5g66500, mitochondrial [Elaeis guineensis]XP_010927627.1 pentatricopeptide repeat-containing protein At5g66500, mitochondrial [Elaeis guineensis]XP_010927628.1 pentatricopeptide repeat-containing protein At5g66500, mitochondrial [Elaeis guineen
MKFSRSIFSHWRFIRPSGRNIFTHHSFGQTPQKDFSSYLNADNPISALLLTLRGGIPLRAHDFPSVLAACSSFPNLGRQVHTLMLKAAIHSQPVPATALLDMYSKCGHVEDALLIFDEMPVRDAVAWNALISCLVRHGLTSDAIAAFHSMVDDGIVFTGHTLCAVLKACASMRALRQGKQIHSWVVGNGYSSVVMGTALIDFYSSFGMIQDAMEVFTRLNCPKDVVVYNALVGGCIQNRQYKEAFTMLRNMRPNGITLTSALSACSELLNLSYGKQIHCVMIRRGFGSDVILCNALMDLYAKCGEITAAHLVFKLITEKNVVSWTCIIDAYGSHGHGTEALKLFRMMEERKCRDVTPNAVTFLAVLTACAHSGLVDEGRLCFFSMRDKYDIDPGPEHYACFIDLLGRAGRIEEAWDLYCGLSESANKLTPAVCVAMLNACRISMDLVKGEHVAKHLLYLDSDNPGSYVLVSNFYAAVGRWEGAEDLRKQMRGKGLKKEVGSSQIAVKGCS